MWRGGFEGEGRYYSPLGVCPLQRGRHRTAGHQLAWMPPGPGNPGKRADEGVIRLISEGRSHSTLKLSALML